MTGSPIFKFKPTSSKKQKIHRKLSLDNVNEVHSAISGSNNATGSDLDSLNHKGTHNVNSFPLSVVSKGKFEPMQSRSICSSSSSFVLPSKRGVKRKLDFDIDVGSDEVGSFRFSDKNISLCGLRSKTSSAVDNRSLPEFCNATFSPNKRRSLFGGSYSRSSVASVVSCRRQLFPESEPPPKKPKFTSPDLCRKRTEVKLSLKKKFPGVPNSDSARSGLLLNLAFSKYNLSNQKKKDMFVDFVDNAAVSTMTKRDFVHYSQIKKDESSLSRSPVFMAIKKVKRKLNLEDPDTSVIRTGMVNDSSSILFPNVNDAASTVSKLRNTESVDLAEESVGADLVIQRDMCATISNKEADLKNLGLNSKNVTLPSPTTLQPVDVHCGSPSFSLKKSKMDRNFKNDLFKNSKLRSMLRNKIYDLSKVNVDNPKKSTVEENTTNYSSPLLAEKSLLSSSHEEHGGLAEGKNSNITNECKHLRNTCKLWRYDRSKNIINDFNETDLRSVDRNKTFKNIPYRKLPKKWISRDSSLVKSSECADTIPGSDRKFLKSHMNRFLKDCLVSVEQKNQCDENAFTEEDRKYDAVAAHKKPFQVNGESNVIVKAQCIAGNAPSRNQEIIIENVDSQTEPFTIENIESQNEPILIENVESQGKQTIFSNINDKPKIDDINLLLSSPPNLTMSIDLKDVLRTKSKKLNKSVNTEITNERHSNDLTKERVSVGHSKVEPVSTSVSYACIQFTNPKESTTCTPDKNPPTLRSNDSQDTCEKINAKKRAVCSLTHRLDKLLNREKSNFHMWKYEAFKTTKRDDDINTKAAVFCIEKMWKEYSFVILQCYFFQQQVPDMSSVLDQFQSFTTEISNAVTIILEQDYCPKNLTYSTVFQVHPPWKLLHFKKYDTLLMLKPRKISIISKDGNPILYKNPIPFNCTTTKKQNIFCSCTNLECECILPDRYQFLIEPFMVSALCMFEPKEFSYSNYTDLESFNSRCISDLVVKYKLSSCQYLILELQILHVYRLEKQNELPLWYLICEDEKKHVCCVLVKGHVDIITTRPVENTIFKFYGILPWKSIPFENVALFTQLVHFTNIPEDVQRSINSQSMVVFTLSEKYGDVKYL